MSETVQQITILYSYDLSGEVERLPRLYTFLQQIREQTDRQALLLDLGGACTAGIWHCEATGGRSTLVVLDGMGYHAANVGGYLTASEQERLKTSLTIGMVDQQRIWRYHVPPLRDEGILIAAQEVPALRLCIVAAPAPRTELRSRTLYLQRVRRDQIGMAQVDLSAQPVLTGQIIYDVPQDLIPDVTISAAVEFVLEEAQEFRKRRP